jgi:hypothetical protein
MLNKLAYLEKGRNRCLPIIPTRTSILTRKGGAEPESPDVRLRSRAFRIVCGYLQSRMGYIGTPISALQM